MPALASFVGQIPRKISHQALAIIARISATTMSLFCDAEKPGDVSPYCGTCHDDVLVDPVSLHPELLGCNAFLNLNRIIYVVMILLGRPKQLPKTTLNKILEEN
jgi:hypothetical protein